MQGIPNRRALGFIMMTLTLISCGGSDITPELPRTIAPTSPTPQPPTNPPTNPPPGGGTPSCAAFSQTKDSDNDGLKDGQEFFGFQPPESTISYRSDFEMIDTDYDGRSDYAELYNKKVAGYTINNVEPLTKNVPLSPYQRDFVVFVFARGGENSNQITGSNGWNSYTGIGSPNDSRSQMKALNGEKIQIKILNDTSLVDVAKIPLDWRPRSAATVYESTVGCWRGTYGTNQGGCIGGVGEVTNTSSCSNSFDCVGNEGNTTINPQNGNLTRRNSLVGRFSITGNRLAAIASEPNVFAFPIGHIKDSFTAQQGNIVSIGNGETAINSPNYNQFLLLRNQDNNGNSSLDDNSGFIVTIVRFIDQSMANKWNRAPTTAETNEFYNKLRLIYGPNACTS